MEVQSDSAKILVRGGILGGKLVKTRLVFGMAFLALFGCNRRPQTVITEAAPAFKDVISEAQRKGQLPADVEIISTAAKISWSRNGKLISVEYGVNADSRNERRWITVCTVPGGNTVAMTPGPYDELAHFAPDDSRLFFSHAEMNRMSIASISAIGVGAVK